MRAAVSSLGHRLGVPALIARYGYWRLALIAIPHLTALAIMFATEARPVEVCAFLLTWGILNFVWLVLTRRPAVAGVLSLVMMTVLVLLSDLKYHVLMMTANFVDLMIIDTDTVSFLFTIFPALRWIVALCLFILIPVVVVTWRFDQFRIHRWRALAGAVGCVVGLTALEMRMPMQPFEAFYGGNQVSSFARSGVDAISELMTHGLMEADANTTDHLQPLGETSCRPDRKPPHIILIHDEFELRHPHGAEREGAGRLRRSLQVVRRQGAQLPGRGQWRSKLVHRI